MTALRSATRQQFEKPGEARQEEQYEYATQDEHPQICLKETVETMETLLSWRVFLCFPQSQFEGILLTKSECWVLELPSTT
jgi:hypothetical protein